MTTLPTAGGVRHGGAYDVIVVGAGLVGAAIAAHLVREGMDTVVLEARRVAGGATGRCLGVVSGGLNAPYAWVASVYGRQRAHEIWALTVGGVARLVEAAQRLGVPVQQVGGLALASTEEEAELLWESAKLLREDGFSVSFSLRDPLDRGFEAALRSHGNATVDAAALTRALLNASGVTVHQGSEVYGLEPAGDGVRVWSSVRTATCQTVVLAVNGYAPLVDPYLADKVRPSHRLVIVTNPVDKPMPQEPCTADGGNCTIRSLPDGRLLLGLLGDPTFDAFGDPLVHSSLGVLSRHFPDIDLERADRWSEVAGFTHDGLPLLGKLPGVGQAYFAVGFNGRGLNWAFVAADRLVKAIRGESQLGLLSAARLE